MELLEITQKGITGPEKLKKMLHFFDKHFDRNAAYKILDVGGTTYSYKYIQECFPNGQIYVLNNNKGDVSNLINHIIGDACCMEKYYERNTFDIIISTDLIEHLTDPDSFVDGCKYCLKPGGKILITTPNLSMFYNRIALLFGYTPYNYTPSTRHRVNVLFSNNKFPAYHKSVFTINGLKELLKINGFEIISSDGFSYSGKIYSGSGGETYEKLRKYVDIFLPIGLKEGILILALKP